jgi:hypothetical protein
MCQCCGDDGATDPAKPGNTFTPSSGTTLFDESIVSNLFDESVDGSIVSKGSAACRRGVTFAARHPTLFLLFPCSWDPADSLTDIWAALII